MQHSTRKPTKAEARRIEEMMQLGCAACATLGIWVVAQECHHIIEGGRRLGHTWTLPLCKPHHQKVPFSLAQQLCIPEDKRVSIADGSKAFNRAYPTERQLWEQVQDRLKLPKVWPLSKVSYEQHP